MPSVFMMAGWGRSVAENTALVRSWTRCWVLSRSTFLWQLDLCLDRSGALWLLCKHMDPRISKDRAENMGDFSRYLGYAPDFIT